MAKIDSIAWRSILKREFNSLHHVYRDASNQSLPTVIPALEGALWTCVQCCKASKLHTVPSPWYWIKAVEGTTIEGIISHHSVLFLDK